MLENDDGIVLVTEIFRPGRSGLALVFSRDGPGACESVVDRRDVVVHDATVSRIEIDALLGDGLIIGVERNAGRVDDARPAEATGLDFKHVVAAGAILVEPLAD